MWCPRAVSMYSRTRWGARVRGRAGEGVQTCRVTQDRLACGERTAPRRTRPRRRPLRGRPTRRTNRRPRPAHSGLKDPDPQVLTISPFPYENPGARTAVSATRTAAATVRAAADVQHEAGIEASW